MTRAGASPGACETGVNNGGTYNPNATCPDPCNGDAFVAAFFGPAAVWNITTDWSFSYEAQGGGLAFRRWTNAGSGNLGDIATS